MDGISEDDFRQAFDGLKIVLAVTVIQKNNTRSKRKHSFRDGIRRSLSSKIFACSRFHTPSARYAQKTVAFHLEFGSEIFENARYEMKTLYSVEHLKTANEARGQPER